MPRPRNPLDSMEGRVCLTCKIWKSRDQFYPSKETWNGIRSSCIECKKVIKQIEKVKYYDRRIKDGRRYRSEKKKLVVQHYTNGSMKCKNCDVSDIRVLSVDHIDGGGAKHRKEIKPGIFYVWLIREGFPEGFQILCLNCQKIKQSINKEYNMKGYSPYYDVKEA